MHSSRFKAICHVAKSIFSQLAFVGMIASLLLAIPSAVVGYRFYTSRSAYMMNKGAAALARGDLIEAQKFSDRLRRNGYDSAAHVLRGKIFLSQAMTRLENAPLPFPYEGVQRASEIVLSGASLNAYPPVLRAPGWLAPVQVQRRFPRHISGADDLLDALGEFTQVMDRDPWAAEATALAGECMVRLGDYRSAELVLTSLVERQPDNLNAHRWLAGIYVDLNATIPAATQLQEWVRLDPGDPRPYRQLCLILRESEEGYPKAIDNYRKLLQLDLKPGERATVLRELAETQIAVADYSQALETLAEAPEAFQNEPTIRLLHAECLQGLSNNNQARLIVDDVLKQHPNLAGALLFRAKIYLQENQPRPAIALLETLLYGHTDNIQVRQSLMIAYRTSGDNQHANEQKQILGRLQAPQDRLTELERISANNPWNSQARLEAALLNSGINNSLALIWIHCAFASNPDDPRIRKVWVQLAGYQPPPLLRNLQRRRQVNNLDDE